VSRLQNYILQYKFSNWRMSILYFDTSTFLASSLVGRDGSGNRRIGSEIYLFPSGHRKQTCGHLWFSEFATTYNIHKHDTTTNFHLNESYYNLHHSVPSSLKEINRSPLRVQLPFISLLYFLQTVASSSWKCSLRKPWLLN